MRLLEYIIVAALALSVLQHAIAALLIVGGLMLLWGILFRPQAIFGFAAFCVLCNAVQHNLIMITLCIALSAIKKLIQAK